MINTLRILLFLLVFGVFGVGGGSTWLRADEVTDLQAALAKTTDGRERVKLLIPLANLLASNDPELAVKYATEARTLAIQQNDIGSQGAAALNLSTAQFRLGELDLSRAAAEEGRSISRTLQDRESEAGAILNLGNVFMARSEWKEAIARYQESLALLDAKAHPGDAANAHANIGGCWLSLGDVTQAQQSLEQALTLYHSAQNSIGEASCLQNLGVLALRKSDYATATSRFTEAMTLSENAGDLRTSAIASGNLATIFVDQIRLDDAAGYLDRSIALSRQISDKGSLSGFLVNLSTVRQKQQRLPEARTAAQEALRLAEELNDARLIGLARSNLGDVFIEEKDAVNAVKELEAAEKALAQVGDITHLPMIRIRLARAYRLAGQSADALAAARRGLASAEQKNQKRTIIAALDELLENEEITGDVAGALRDARRARTVERELLNATTAEKIAEAQTRYETEKKTRQIEVLERDGRIQGLTIERQRQTRNFTFVALGFLALVVLLALNAYRIKRKAARILAEKNVHLEEANTIIAAERAKSDQLLLSILPAPIAAQLKESSGTIAKSHAHATVLFADLVNFTSLSQSITPEELVGMLDRIFTRFDALASKHGVEKIKTIGDCYMVVAGLPEPVVEHCERIARLALEMHREIHAFNEEEGLALQVRIGFHTGPVVAGVIGRQKFIYDLWGDTVNTASRMESTGVPGKIQVSETVAHALAGKFSCESRGEIEVKGKGRLHTYFLHAIMPSPAPASALP